MYCSKTQRKVFKQLEKTEGLPLDDTKLLAMVVDPEMAAEIVHRLKTDPENADLWCGKAMINFEGDFRQAIDDFSMALAYKPFSGDLHYYRGRKYISLDLFEEALADCRKAVRLDPEDRAKWHYLGVAQFYLGLYEDAVASFREAIRMNLKHGVEMVPSETDWSWMANMRLGRKSDAQAVLRFVDETTPIEKSDLMYKKRCLLYKGLLSEEDYRNSMDLTDEVHGMSELYGLANYCYYLKGDVRESVRLLDQVLAYPTFHHAFAYKFALEERDLRAAEL